MVVYNHWTTGLDWTGLDHDVIWRPGFQEVPFYFFTPQLAGKARQLGCPKIVLDHVRVLYIYIYICLCAPQCLSTRCIGNT